MHAVNSLTQSSGRDQHACVPCTLVPMQDALTSPHGGFYMHRDVFGAAGHFTTSPEISQMFGEVRGRLASSI